MTSAKTAIHWKNRVGSLTKCPDKWQGPAIFRALGTQETIVIAEPAVYQAAFRSNKPKAIIFTEWVCEEVLPSIRRQGFYGSATAGQQIALRSQKLKLLVKLCGTRDAFVAASVMTSLRSVCNALGEPMPVGE